MPIPEGRLTIWTEAPPIHKPVQLQVMVDRDRIAAAYITAEEFERTMQQWLALSNRKAVPA